MKHIYLFLLFGFIFSSAALFAQEDIVDTTSVEVINEKSLPSNIIDNSLVEALSGENTTPLQVDFSLKNFDSCQSLTDELQKYYLRYPSVELFYSIPVSE